MQKYLVATLMALFFGWPHVSQGGALTLPQALELAERHSPMLRAATSQARGAVAGLDTARAFPNPELEYGSGNSRLLPPTALNGQNRLVAVSQPLEWPGVRSARAQAAEAGIRSGASLLDEARINLHAQVKLGYSEVLRRDEEAQLAEQGRALLDQIRNRVKLRVDVGEAPRYELVKSEAEVLAAENIVHGATVQIQQARDRLRAVIGAELPPGFEVEPATLSEKELPPLENLRQEVLERQPLLRAAHAETERAEARLEQERALRLPQPTLKWSAEQHPDVRLWRMGVAMPLPLWDRRAGPVGEAQAALERARADEDRIRLNLLAELDQAHGRYRIARSQLHTFENGLMRDAENALKVAEAAYRFGERGILDYLDAQRVFRTTRLDHLTARYELQAALIDIERLRAVLLTGETR